MTLWVLLWEPLLSLTQYTNTKEVAGKHPELQDMQLKEAKQSVSLLLADCSGVITNTAWFVTKDIASQP